MTRDSVDLENQGTNITSNSSLTNSPIITNQLNNNNNNHTIINNNNTNNLIKTPYNNTSNTNEESSSDNDNTSNISEDGNSMAETQIDNISNNDEESIIKTGKDAIIGLPNEQALLDLLERTGYTIVQNNGQRRYGPTAENITPGRGCEVFVGKIPRDCFEDELVPIFETVGCIHEIRLMMDYNGQNRGYAFVVFYNRKDAQRAVKTLNNFELRKGRLLGVCHSVDNCRLFVGGIPKKVKRDEILQEISKVTEQVVDVIVYPLAVDKTKNRGFAFVEYESHRAAAVARRKLMSGRIQLWGHPIAVDWAEPEQEVDEEIMEQVKVLYVRNLYLSTTEDTIEEIFIQYGEVERVKKIKDYCFVHFTTREGARDAMNGIQGQTIDGAEVEVTLAKPVDKEHYRQQRAVAKLMQMAQSYNNYNCVPEMPQYGYQYGAQFPSIVGYSQQGMPIHRFPTYSRDPVNVGKPMVRGRGRTAAGSRSAGGRAFLLNGFLPSLNAVGPTGFQNNNYYSYQRRGKQVPEDRLYDILPGMDLAPTNPVTLKHHSSRTPIQLLDDFCQKSNLGTPIYTLHSTLNQDNQLFMYKVSIPGLSQTFQPQKLCRTIDDAKLFAAEYVLGRIAPADSSPQLSPVTTNAPFHVRAMPQGVTAAVNGNRSPGDAANFAGYIPITTAPTMVAKMSWPAGMPAGPEGVYGNYEYPDQQAYQQNVYQQY